MWILAAVSLIFLIPYLIKLSHNLFLIIVVFGLLAIWQPLGYIAFILVEIYLIRTAIKRRKA